MQSNQGKAARLIALNLHEARPKDTWPLETLLQIASDERDWETAFKWATNLYELDKGNFHRRARLARS